jgi:hypothetical protein
MHKAMVRSRWMFLVAGLCLSAAVATMSVALRAADTPPARVFEMRTYCTLPGRLEALQQRFRQHTLKLFEKHGMTNIGYWVPQDNPARENTLIYVIAHASREQAKANWAAFAADPEWQKVAAASQKDGKIIDRIESVFMDATDYSPMK